MYFVATRAVVSLCTHAPKEGKPQLNAHAWLECKDCRNTTEVAGPMIDLELAQDRLSQVMHKPVTDFTASQLSQFVHRQMMIFKAVRKCGQCGDYSGLPDSDEVMLEKELCRLITAQWLNQKIDGLILSRSQRDRSDRIRQRRIQRAGREVVEKLTAAQEPTQVIDAPLRRTLTKAHHALSDALANDPSDKQSPM